MLNTAGMEDLLYKVLALVIILGAIFIALRARKGRVSDAGSMALVVLIAVVVAGFGVLVGTDFGRNVIGTIFNV